MNNKSNKATILFLIAVICTLALLFALVIEQSTFFVNGKHGFAVAAIAAAVVSVLFLLNFRDDRIQQSYSKNYAAKCEEAEKYKSRTMELAEEAGNLRSQLECYTSGKVKEEYDALKEKCGIIENFRNSFPHKISEGYIIYNIMRTDLQTGRHSSWQIVGEYEGELWEVGVIRPDTQTFREMFALVSKTQAPEGVSALNSGASLLWQ